MTQMNARTHIVICTHRHIHTGIWCTYTLVYDAYTKIMWQVCTRTLTCVAILVRTHSIHSLAPYCQVQEHILVHSRALSTHISLCVLLSSCLEQGDNRPSVGLQVSHLERERPQQFRLMQYMIWAKVKSYQCCPFKTDLRSLCSYCSLTYVSRIFGLPTRDGVGGCWLESDAVLTAITLSILSLVCEK